MPLLSAMSDDALISVRLMEPGDRAFVAASWFESYWKATASQEMDYETYKAGQSARIDRALNEGLTHVVYAKQYPDEILGYAVFTGEARNVLQYVYVKSVYRKQGIASGLARRAVDFTHKTRAGQPLVKKLNLKFNPYAVP